MAKQQKLKAVIKNAVKGTEKKEPRVAYNVTRKRLEDLDTGKPVKREKTEAVALRGDVLPPESPAESMLRNADDEQRLDNIKVFIERGLAASRKITCADTFNGVTIGMALRAAKDMLRKGMYEKWVETEFPNFSERQAQYYGKLADVFLRETGGTVMLPPPKEVGSFLMRADQEDSPVTVAVRQFVGDMTMAELLDKYRIKPKKAKGGFRPGNYLVARYQAENEHLQNKPFEVWPDADKAAFQAWSDKEISENGSAQTITAAEGVWTNIKKMLVEYGLKRESFAVLTKAQLEDINETLVSVGKKVKAALAKA